MASKNLVKFGSGAAQIEVRMPRRCTSFVPRLGGLDQEDDDVARLVRVEKTRQRRESVVDSAV